MIATPIINPIVLLSTYNAFPTMPEMVVYRAACGFLGAVLIGALVNRAEGKSVLRDDVVPSCNCGCEHDHVHTHNKNAIHSYSDSYTDDLPCNTDETDHSHTVEKSGTLKAVLFHTNAELQSVGIVF